LQATGLARSTIYRMIAEGTFPAPIKVAKRAVAWYPDPLRQWMDARRGASR
jgi:prophage regulatory protein